MSQIETYRHEGNGYNPFFIREGWQVAQLNYIAAQDLHRIDRMERHRLTDEVFILLKGTALLIGATGEAGHFKFESILMQSGVTYNIPEGLWHNIAMSKGTELIIVEKDGTHLNDVEYVNLSEDESHRLHDDVLRLI